MLTDRLARIVRERFYDQQLLKLEDFDREQTFHTGMRELVSRALLDPGILSGLTVDATPDGVVRVRPGAAVDAEGRIVLLVDRATLDGATLTASADGAFAIPMAGEAWTARDRTRTWHLTIRFAETRVENTDNQVSPSPVLTLREDAPELDGSALRLAEIAVTATTTAGAAAPSPAAVTVSVSSSLSQSAALVPALLPRVAASKIDGTLAAAQIPALDAATLTGTLDPARLPLVPAEKIGGPLAVDQIPRLPASKLTDRSLANALLADRAVDGRVIDPQADLGVRSLTVSGRDLLAEIDALKAIVMPPARAVSITNVTSPLYENGEMTITGAGFGDGVRDATAVVTYGDRVALAGPFRDDGRNYVTSWSDTRITLALLGATTSGTVTVTAKGITSNAVPYAIVTAQIASAARSSGTVAAPVAAKASESITVTGVGFGSAVGTIEFPAEAGGGATTQGTVTSWGDTIVVVEVPRDAANGQVSIVPAGFRGSGAPSFAFRRLRPLITAASPEVVTPGDPATGVLTITGTGFGAAPGQVTLSGAHSLTLTPLTWSDTQITVQVPAAANAIQYVVVPPSQTDPDAMCDVIVTTEDGDTNRTFEVGGARRSATSIRVDGPHLLLLLDGAAFSSGVVHAITTASRGADVVLLGRSFGDAAGSVTIGGVTAPIASWSHQSIHVIVPTSVTSGDVVVTTAAIAVSNALHLEVT